MTKYSMNMHYFSFFVCVFFFFHLKGDNRHIYLLEKSLYVAYFALGDKVSQLNNPRNVSVKQMVSSYIPVQNTQGLSFLTVIIWADYLASLLLGFLSHHHVGLTAPTN